MHLGAYIYKTDGSDIGWTKVLSLKDTNVNIKLIIDFKCRNLLFNISVLYCSPLGSNFTVFYDLHELHKFTGFIHVVQHGNSLIHLKEKTKIKCNQILFRSLSGNLPSYFVILLYPVPNNTCGVHIWKHRRPIQGNIGKFSQLGFGHLVRENVITL